MNIVCFGDSLTEGYQSVLVSRGEVLTPYGMFLQERLGPKGTVWIRGVCGETTEDMRGRFSSDVLALDPHYVVILGGTNDLGWGFPPRMVAENLFAMYVEAKSHGIAPVALTVPSVGGTGDRTPWDSPYPKAIRERVEVNEALKKMCAGEGIPLVDLFRETCEKESQELAPEYSEDGIHFTTLGYRKIAELLWEQVFQGVCERG